MSAAYVDPGRAVKAHIERLLDELVSHEGFGTLTVELRLLRRGQKEIILHCDKQYRYVIDFEPNEGRAPRRASRTVDADAEQE